MKKIFIDSSIRRVIKEDPFYKKDFNNLIKRAKDLGCSFFCTSARQDEAPDIDGFECAIRLNLLQAPAVIPEEFTTSLNPRFEKSTSPEELITLKI